MAFAAPVVEANRAIRNRGDLSDSRTGAHEALRQYFGHARSAVLAHRLPKLVHELIRVSADLRRENRIIVQIIRVAQHSARALKLKSGGKSLAFDHLWIYAMEFPQIGWARAHFRDVIDDDIHAARAQDSEDRLIKALRLIRAKECV